MSWIITPGFNPFNFAEPSLDLRFSQSKNLVDVVSGSNKITFSRASSATYIDENGSLQTAAIDVPRFTHDPVTGASLGLMIEEQRTNLLTNSAVLSTQSITVTNRSHVLHFTGTGTVSLSGSSSAGPLTGTGNNEANRVSLVFTPTAGTLTLTVSGQVLNAQLEASSYTSSYIPTQGVPVTRSQDFASLQGANFTSWYSYPSHTIYAEFTHKGSAITAGNEVGIISGSTGSYFLNLTSGDSLSMYSNTTSRQVIPGLGQYGKFAVSNSIGLNYATPYPSLGATNRPANMLQATALFLGRQNDVAARCLNGTFKRVTFWPVNASTSELISLVV